MKSFIPPRECRFDSCTGPVEEEEEKTYDHEHPCPTREGCIRYWRGKGADMPQDTECCVCWLNDNNL